MAIPEYPNLNEPFLKKKHQLPLALRPKPRTRIQF